ncbi:MAG TPA: NAD(P)-dependent oxidoreductase [Mycobacteriales bacterium]|nr:NAD(P)-dependent oxidoreductase [Mycobacteriales bacterium]
MRVLLAGATGAIGRQLTPLLAANGHQVFGLIRPDRGPGRVRDLGGTAIIGDLLDAGQVMQATERVEPEAIIHMATAIPRDLNPRRFATQFAATDRLRREGTRHLLRAAAQHGVHRVIAQSIAFGYEPAPDLADEDAPLWTTPPKPAVDTFAALRELEQQVLGASGVVLRFGHLYGPGTSFASNGGVILALRAGKLPIVGGGGAVFSFTHTYDAATSVLAALDSSATGAFNVVDSDPTPAHVWIPEVATALKAPRPRKVPAGLARLAAGSWGVAYMTKLRGADNTRAMEQLGWKPRYESWRTGLVEDILGRT